MFSQSSRSYWRVIWICVHSLKRSREGDFPTEDMALRDAAIRLLLKFLTSSMILPVHQSDCEDINQSDCIVLTEAVVRRKWQLRQSEAVRRSCHLHYCHHRQQQQERKRFLALCCRFRNFPRSSLAPALRSGSGAFHTAGVLTMDDGVREMSERCGFFLCFTIFT